MNNMSRKNVATIVKFISPALTSFAVALIMFASMNATGSEANPQAGPALPQPSADLQPGEIVEIVVGALAKNDQPYPNAGIETTFNFASPANKAYTGPLERFARLVKGPVFGQMINHRGSTLSEVVVDGDKAVRLVRIVSANYESFYYAFRLGLQQEGDYAGMWLTEAVWPLENPEADTLAL